MGGIVALYALNGGGFDIVFRQEAGLAIAWTLAVGYVLGVLPLSNPPEASYRVAVAFGALLAWTVVSLLWTDSSERTTAEIARVLHYMGLVGLAWSILGRRTWRPACAGLATAGLAVSCLSLIARLSPATFDSASSELLNSERLSYPLDYWNGVGAWSAMALCMGLAWSVHARAKGARALALSACPAVTCAVYMSYSRSGVAGALLGVALLLALDPRRDRLLVNVGAVAATTAGAILVIRSFPEIAEGTGDAGAGWIALTVLAAGAVCAQVGARRRSRRRELRVGRTTMRRVAVASAVALIGFMVALGPQTATSITQSFTGASPDPQADPANRFTGLGGDRHELWESSLDAFLSEPLAGIGPGTFQFWWSQDPEHDSEVLDAHSLYLETLAELGLPGLIAIVALITALGLAIRGAWANAKRESDRGLIGGLGAAFAVFVVIAAADWMWELTAVAALGLLSAATAIASSSPRRSSSIGGWLRAGLAFAAILAGIVQIPGLVSTDRERQSAEIVLDDPQRALDLADDSVAAEPWAATPYVRRSFAYEVLGEGDLARSDIFEAEDREPTNWRHPIRLARLENELGDQAASRAAFDRARELKPTIPDDRRTVLDTIEAGLAR